MASWAAHGPARRDAQMDEMLAVATCLPGLLCEQDVSTAAAHAAARLYASVCFTRGPRTHSQLCAVAAGRLERRRMGSAAAHCLHCIHIHLWTRQWSEIMQRHVLSACIGNVRRVTYANQEPCNR